MDHLDENVDPRSLVIFLFIVSEVEVLRHAYKLMDTKAYIQDAD